MNDNRIAKMSGHREPVEMLRVGTGEVLASFPSQREASRVTGIPCSSICKCCNRVYVTAGGFGWRKIVPAAGAAST